MIRRGEDRTPWSSSARPLGLAVIVLGACAAYYAGSLIGLQLRLQTATTSVLWPPNAVLTSVLLLTPPRRWLLLLACVLPVHVLIQLLSTGWPVPLIGTLFLTNSSEALLAAGGLHLLSDTPWRFDTIRRLMAFFVAVVLIAPALSSFGDAAAVSWWRGEPYWSVWQTRTVGNILAELTVVPGIVGGALVASKIWRERAIPRAIEAGALAVALAAVGWLQFTSSAAAASIGAVSSRTPLALQLPLILWAALRFGVAGTGLTLLFTSILTAWSVVHGVGPFAAMTATATVSALTLSLIIVSATVLCLATLTEERRQTQHELSVRLQFEGLLSHLSRALLELPGDQLHAACEAWLGRIGRVIGVDTLALFVVPREGQPMAREYAWTAPGLALPADAVIEQQARWAREALDSREVAAYADASGLAAGGAIPLVGHGQVLGALAYGSLRADAAADPPPNAWLLAEVLASALNRRRAERELRRAEIEAQRTREELAHVARVSTVGEMTASLAHQLNQPLTAIMTNAHAARRIMTKDAASDPDTVRAILSDIVSDARRASDVIQHLRDFLRKGQLDMTRLSVSRVVRDVVDLARSEAIIREIDVTVDCPGAHYVRADRVQIQQVVLNLLHNAMDAVEQTEPGTRRIVIACRTLNGHALSLRVHDSGPGLEPGTEEMVFDPFYTTKRGGMGMGLSIVRSIVEAHGGSVRAVNDADRGAVVEVTLPPYRAGAEE